MRYTTLAAALVVGLTTAGPALAQDAQLVDLERLFFPVGDHALIAVPGSFGIIYGQVDPITVAVEEPGEADATRTDAYGHVHFRFSPSLTLTGNTWPVFQVYQLAGELEGRFWIDSTVPASLALDPELQNRSARENEGLFEPIQAYALAAGRRVAIKAGLMRSNWGTGLLANDGLDAKRPTVRTSPFGYSRFSDRVIRVQVGYFPFDPPRRAAQDAARPPPPLTIALAGDAVMQDSTADWAEGDRTYNGIIAAIMQLDRVSAGIYGVYRNQSHASSEGDTEVFVGDLQVMGHILDPRGETKLWVEAELAGMLGTTTYSQSVFLPEGYDIASWGGLLRVGVEHGAMEAVVETGHATGDDNSFDDTLHTFSFNREYRVGLLMFREVLKATTAVSAYNIADETFRAEPPRGYERLANGGSVQGATYLNPRVLLRASESFALMGGLLLGWAPSGYTDPFRSGVAGGASVGPRGAVEPTFIGAEVDLGLQVDVAFEHIKLRGRAELAWFTPGDVFDDAQGNSAADVIGFWFHTGVIF